MKSRQRRQHMHEQRVKRKAAKAQKRVKTAIKASNTRFAAFSGKRAIPQGQRQKRAESMDKPIPQLPFLQLFKTWQPPQSDRKVIPFPVFQSNRKARAEMERAS
jgi:FtsZ-interacting cell division protein ZipA